MNRAAPAKRRRTKIPSRRQKQVLRAPRGQRADRGRRRVNCCLSMLRQNQGVCVCEQQHDDLLDQRSVSPDEPNEPGDQPHLANQEGTAWLAKGAP